MKGHQHRDHGLLSFLQAPRPSCNCLFFFFINEWSETMCLGVLPTHPGVPFCPHVTVSMGRLLWESVAAARLECERPPGVAVVGGMYARPVVIQCALQLPEVCCDYFQFAR